MIIAVQNYTLREQLDADLPGTLAALAGIGYRWCELAGTHGHSPEKLLSELEEHGLRACSSHVGLDRLELDFAGVVAEAQMFGYDTIVVPWVSEERYKNGWASFGEVLEGHGQRLKEQGLRLAYHNHSFEFAEEGGVPGLQVLFDSTDPNLVLSELDTYWVADGGGDPAQWITMLKDRLPLLHAKDRSSGYVQTFAEVGYGTLDWSSILSAAQDAGTRFVVVELDICPRPPLESVAMAFEFLKAQGLDVQ